MRRLVNILGVPVDDVTMAETLDLVAGLVESGRRSKVSHQVATVNVDFVVNATKDPELLAILQEASISLPDGMPIVWASRLLGTRIRERVAGADLVEKLAERAASNGFRMYLFGSAPGVAARAATTLTDKFPTLEIVADAGPFVGPDGTMDPTHVERIAAARPDVVCVALGNPKQEFWIRRHAHGIGAPVLIGVGGTLDLIVGEKQRAPLWMQRVGLEWLFRAQQEPGRLARRYATDFASFVPRLARQVWIGRPRRGRRGFVRPLDRSATLVSLVGSPRLDDVERAAHIAVETVDLSDFDRPDNASADLLLSLAAESRRRGSRLVLRGVSDGVRQRLADLGIDQAFAIEREVGC